jgi:C4-dicarboxylate-binding protein DctP
VFSFRHALTLLTLVGLLAGCGGDGDRRIVLKFPHVVALGTPKGQGAERLRALIEERLGDRVVMEVYPSGQLMNEDDAIEMLAFGEVQMIAPSLSKFDRLTRKFQVFDLPFLFADLEEVETFQQSPVGQELLGELSHKGFLGVAYWHNGMKQFGGPRPMRRPEDAAGMKFRIMESDVLEAQILAMGANPQKMAFSEVYQALQTGAIDAQENTWSNNYSQKFFEVQPFYTESNHGYLGYLVVVNPGYWKRLPEDIREALEAIIAEVTAEVNANSTTLNAQDRARILEAGKSQIIQPSVEDLAAWRAAMRPVWEAFAGEIGPEIMAATPAGRSD